MRTKLGKLISVLFVLSGICVFNYFVKVDFIWRQRSAEASGPASGPQTTIHFEQTRADVNMREETYIVYSDFDQDGDIDIAYTTDSPIRFIENKSAERRSQN